jgi:excisionase family DNA binding protein
MSADRTAGAEVLTAKEAALMLPLNIKTVYEMVHRRQMPGARWFRGTVRIHRPTLVCVDGTGSEVIMSLKNGSHPATTGAPMAAYYRLAHALREAADAVEEIASGKPKQRRHRGPVRVEHGPLDEQTLGTARAVLRRAGLVPVNGGR